MDHFFPKNHFHTANDPATLLLFHSSSPLLFSFHNWVNTEDKEHYPRQQNPISFVLMGYYYKNFETLSQTHHPILEPTKQNLDHVQNLCETHNTHSSQQIKQLH